MTKPIEVDNLPPTQYLMLEVLAARYRLGEQSWSFPKNQRHIAEQLARTGLVSWKSSPAPETILVWFTDAGKKLMLDRPYTPPILQREELPRQPLDLRALAVILDMGRRGAEQMREAGLSHAFAFMAEQAVALHRGPSHIIGNLDDEFAQVEARYQ
ncbi:hypothetical protein ABZY58_11150 [Micromonospora tulbaghiae]|uniref:hypothetical protein n=1 Tax=Micromonospora tulbaghiae TaxID=479978 RepID=UPI0033ADE4E4